MHNGSAITIKAEDLVEKIELCYSLSQNMCSVMRDMDHFKTKNHINKHMEVVN